MVTNYITGFFLPLAGLAILIFLLSLLQYGIEGNRSKNTSNTDEKHHLSDEQQGNVDQARYDPVADAIHTFRRHRQADEGERAQRERVTIIVLIFTAVAAI